MVLTTESIFPARISSEKRRAEENFKYDEESTVLMFGRSIVYLLVKLLMLIVIQVLDEQYSVLQPDSRCWASDL